MLFWLENGYKLNQINGNSGVYVATRGIKSAVLVTNQFDELERRSEWFRSEAAATAEAEAIVADRKLAFA
jgi:hypothetical protein